MKQLTPSAVAVCAFNILVERSGSTSGARKPDATNTGTSVDRHRLRVSLFAKSAMPSCSEFNPCPAAKTGTSAKTARILIGAPTSATRGPLPLWAGARLLSGSEYQEASSRVTAVRAEAGHTTLPVGGELTAHRENAVTTIGGRAISAESPTIGCCMKLIPPHLVDSPATRDGSGVL